jgi:hypothetical protein
MGANISLNMDFIVLGNGTALTLEFNNVVSMFELVLTNFTLTPHIDSIRFNDIEAVNSQIGTIDTKAI